MNHVDMHGNLPIFTTLVTILFTFLFPSTVITSSLHPIYPCHYADVNQRIFKCDICACRSSTGSFSLSNLCSTLSSSSLLFFCTSNDSTKLMHENILRARLNEIESESAHQSISQYSMSTKRSFNDLHYELDYFSNEIWNNFLQFEQICSSMNQTRVTFYRLQTNLSVDILSQCPMSLLSLRFLDTIIESNALLLYTRPETLIFYNCTFLPSTLNLTTTTTSLSLYYTKFQQKPFQINSLSSLIYLTISHTSHFDLIGSYPSLIYLDLCHTQLTDEQLNRLFSQIDMPDLVTLILTNNQLTVLKTKFPSTIRYLDLSYNQLKSLDYISFKSLYSLNTLNLSYNVLGDIQQDTFTRIPYLEVLDLTACLPNSPIDDLFLPLQKLRFLNLSSNHLTTLPRLPIPYDAHTIASYDHHLPVLYVDLSKNDLNQIDFETFSSASTQDKYIISIDMSFNQLKTLQFPPNLLTGQRRRGPLIELNIHHNPLECDCTLYENLSPLLKNDPGPSPSFPPLVPYQVVHSPSSAGHPSSLVNPSLSSGYYIPQYQQVPPAVPPLIYTRSRRQYVPIVPPSPVTVFAQNLAKQVRMKFLNLDTLTCQDLLQATIQRSLFELNSSISFCSYTKHCPSSCSCCSSSSTFLFSDSNCFCYDQCPIECSCKRSFDSTKNYINCSHRDLHRIPTNLPISVTHLDLNSNQLKSLGKNLTLLTKLQSLSIAKNQIESLNNEEFHQLTKLEDLDLSLNRIGQIHPRTFSSLFNLKHLYLHNNPWIPRFYTGQGEFQSNKRLNYLSYGLGLTCNRSIISSPYSIERPLTPDDCCKHSNIESCQQSTVNDDHFFQSNKQSPSFYNSNSSLWNYQRIIHLLFDEKYRLYVIIGLSLVIALLLVLIVICCLCCVHGKKKERKHPSPAERKLLSNGDAKKTINHYHKSLQPINGQMTPQISLSSSTTAIQKLINSTRQKNSTYRQQQNDGSPSFTDNDDEDDYASIPLTMSQGDLSPVIRPQPAVPPLPPPRQLPSQTRSLLNRPVSHSSTTSTSTTIRSIVPMIKRTNSSASKQQQQSQTSLAPARSCLQIKLDALVLYSINDSELVHGNIGEILEDIYGKRFSFHFIHRERMLGELDWLIENSCVIIVILRKPYHIVHDYMKVLSSCPSVKIFLILVNDETTNHLTSSSIKAREKIAKLYRTSDVYEWNPNPHSLLHEQLELFLERFCGSATYVPY